MTLAKQNCVVKKNLKYEKYPAQMLEVAGDLCRAPAKFENPELLAYFRPKSVIFHYLISDLSQILIPCFRLVKLVHSFNVTKILNAKPELKAYRISDLKGQTPCTFSDQNS